MIPETVSTKSEYEARILQPMYDEIAPHDPDGVLRHEWLNSRAAIPRFDRDAIEIRLVDVQECPQADVAIAAAVVTLVRWLYEENSAALVAQQAIETATLHAVLLATIRDAEEAIVDASVYLRALDVSGSRYRAGDLWRTLLDACARDGADGAWWLPALDAILREGPLARRILRATGGEPSRDRLRDVYGELCACLEAGRMFV